jgi:hypothetical protein
MMTALAVLLHGYHLATGDSAVWIPAIKKIADPSLYPFGSQFFQTPTSYSVFPAILGYLARFTSLPVDWVVFICHILSVFMLLLASWRLARACFDDEHARWGAVAALGLLLTIPVAGTGIAIFDTSVSARSLSTPFLVFAVAGFVSNHYRRGTLWWVCAALINLQMAALGLVFLVCLALVPRLWPAPRPVAIYTMPAFLVPFVWGLEPATGPARDALLSQTSFFITEWHWYHWIGVMALLVPLWFLALMPPRPGTPAVRSLTRSLVPFSLMALAGGLAVSLDEVHLQSYARLQPMRSFHLIYVILVLLVGGLLGEFVMHRRRRRWLALLAPVAIGIFLLQRLAHPGTAHVEIPRAPTSNNWVSAFLWIRDHTPKDATFAVDPEYGRQPGEGRHGFRAIAERSSLADLDVDGAAVAMFPQLAGEWSQELQDQAGWPQLEVADFRKLAAAHPVTWMVDRLPAPAGMVCPYSNREVAVCQILPAESRP